MKHLLLLIALIGCTVFGQSPKISISNTIDLDPLSPNEAFVIQDETNGNFAVFLLSDDYYFSFLYNDKFEQIGSLKTNTLPHKFTSIVGYQINGQKIKFLLNTPNNRSYGMVFFDFETGLNSAYEVNFKLKKETYLGLISKGKYCYLLSADKRASRLNIYKFDDNYNDPLKREINFKEGDFVSAIKKTPKSFGHFFTRGSAATTIERDIPNTIENTSKKVKIYNLDGDNIILTSDMQNDATHTVNVNLETGQTVVRKYEKPELEKDYNFKKSNSFLKDDQLYQMIVTSNYLKYHIKDINTNEVIKAIHQKKEDPISFKNTPILIEGGDFQKYREVEKTAKFLRKIAAMNAGISVYTQNDTEVVTIGGSVEQTNGFYMGFGGGLIGGAISGLFYTYLSYTSTKSVRISGLFDQNNNHILGEVPKNIFDKIKNYSDDIKYLEAELLFKQEDTYIYGFFNNETKTYDLIAF